MTEKRQVNIYIIIWSIITLLFVFIIPIGTIDYLKQNEMNILIAMIPALFWFTTIAPLSPFTRWIYIRNGKISFIDKGWEVAFIKRDYKYFVKQYIYNWIFLIVVLVFYLIIR